VDRRQRDRMVESIVGRKDEIIHLDSPIDNKPIVLRNCTNCTIEDKTFSYNGDGDMLTLENCVDCKILRCTFQNRTNKGNFIHIREKDSKRNRIERCTFKDHTFGGENGGEAIIIGLDRWTGCEFETYVQKCEFINCRGDPELISIKSCGNVLENNRIISNQDNPRGTFSIRNGGFNKIRNNVFEGPSGIRVLGDSNEITGNYHKNNGDGDIRPLAIENGNVETDLNFDNGKPSNKEGGSNDKYARAKKNFIEGNIYENCEGICIVWGRANRDLKPTENTFTNNTLIADHKESRFLKCVNHEGEKDKNTFESNKTYGNKMYGKNAMPADLRGDVKQLEEKDLQGIVIPDAGPNAPQVEAATPPS
jgi:Chondroitinase B